MVNVDELKGMPDVEFDFGVSSVVKAAFSTAGTRLAGQRGDRATWRSTGLGQFEGHFKTIFEQNGTTQLNDLDEVARALRDVASKIEVVEGAAREENQRRKTAREWAQRQADRSGLEKAWDGLFGGEDPPDTNVSETGPATQASAPRTGSRETPAPGGGGGGGGKSSAVPENLRSFATSTSGADGELSGTPGSLETQCGDFASSCSWENPTLARYLEAMSGWIEDLDGYFQNRGERVPDQPTWQVVAAMLSAARVYE